MKRILSAILFIGIMFSVISFCDIIANAETEYTSGNYTYTVSNDEAQITDCKNSATGDVVIPSTLGGYPVTRIGGGAFIDCKYITSVTIPDSVIGISASAFSRCTSLTTVAIPNGVESIGDLAFNECTNLISINIPDSITYIGSHAFKNCKSLTSIKIPDNVTSILGLTFSGCTNLTSITIPDSVTSIGYSAFSECANLKNITIPADVTSIGDSAFYKCQSFTDITIPEGVTSIGDTVFNCCVNLESIKIPDSVESIGRWSFEDCISLKKIVVPDLVISIGSSAFENCISLESVTIPESIEDIDDYAFYNCSSLDYVYYRGDETSKRKINIENTNRNNTYLLNAHWFYNSCLNSSEHTFTNCKDTECNVCDFTRDVTHIYSNSCDESCNDCGDIREITHDYDWVIDKEENCGVDGYKHEECSICHNKQKENTVILATGNHTYDNICDTDCNVCGNIREVTHDYEWVIDKEENCGVDGYKHEECSLCHNKQNENTVIEADGNHSYDNDCDTNCNVCNEIREITHDYEWVIDKKENCGVDGYKHEECNICHSKQNENTVISATENHKYDNDCDKNCNVCNLDRTVSDHIYTNKCDTACNVCGIKRTITHTYKTTTAKATITKNGSIIKKCTVCGKVASNTTIKYPKTIKLSATSCTYNGKVRTPSFIVKDSAGKTISSKYYTVKYSSGRIKVGTYNATITFGGNYSGTKTISFKILAQFRKENGVWKYYKGDGTLNKANTLVKHTDGKYYHVNGGRLVKDTTLVKYNNKWYHVKNGVKSNYTGLFKYNNKWYHICNGVKTNSTTLVKYNNKWYHVKNGAKSTFTGLYKYNGVWYYIKNGAKNDANTLVKHTDGKWYHVKGGKWVKDTAIVKYNSKYYYVKNGIKSNLTGKVKVAGKTYKIKKGVVI